MKKNCLPKNGRVFPKGFAVVFLLAFLTLFLAHGRSFGAEGKGTIRAVASIFPVADMVRAVGGPRVEVSTLLPPGASPHVYEPTPSAVREFAAARVFFKIGAGLELWAERLLTGPQMKVVTLSETMSLIGDSHAHGAEGVANPHIWLDPILAVEMVNKIEKAFSGLDPQNAALYKGNADAYRAELFRLDEEIKKAVSAFKVKSFVSFHAAWDYFAARYGLVCEGVVEEAPGREPTPRRLKSLIRSIKDKGIKAVFAESQFNPRPAEVLAREAGVKVIVLDPVGGPPGRDSYPKLMRYNLSKMKEAFQ